VATQKLLDLRGGYEGEEGGEFAVKSLYSGSNMRNETARRFLRDGGALDMLASRVHEKQAHIRIAELSCGIRFPAVVQSIGAPESYYQLMIKGEDELPWLSKREAFFHHGKSAMRLRIRHAMEDPEWTPYKFSPVALPDVDGFAFTARNTGSDFEIRNARDRIPREYWFLSGLRRHNGGHYSIHLGVTLRADMYHSITVTEATLGYFLQSDEQGLCQERPHCVVRLHEALKQDSSWTVEAGYADVSRGSYQTLRHDRTGRRTEDRFDEKGLQSFSEHVDRELLRRISHAAKTRGINFEETFKRTLEVITDENPDKELLWNFSNIVPNEEPKDTVPSSVYSK
jgi:hypothetical protein